MSKVVRKNIYNLISEEIAEGSKILDLGCGDGSLLSYLIKKRNVIAHGVDIDIQAIIKCMEKGIPIIQMDIDNLSCDFPDKLFDVVLLNQTLQQLKHPSQTINEMLRIGKTCVLGFPNYGNILIRKAFYDTAKMPVTVDLPYDWYDTPNIHLLTINDFYDYCSKFNIKILDAKFLKNCHDDYLVIKDNPNDNADIAIFKITR